MRPRIKTDTYMGLTHPRLLLMDQQTRRSYFRSKIWERDGGRCGLCGEDVPYDEMDIDHIKPRRAGGEDHWDNFRIAHPHCNRVRKDRDIWPGRPRGSRNRPPATPPAE